MDGAVNNALCKKGITQIINQLKYTITFKSINCITQPIVSYRLAGLLSEEWSFPPGCTDVLEHVKCTDLDSWVPWKLYMYTGCRKYRTTRDLKQNRSFQLNLNTSFSVAINLKFMIASLKTMQISSTISANGQCSIIYQPPPPW